VSRIQALTASVIFGLLAGTIARAACSIIQGPSHADHVPTSNIPTVEPGPVVSGEAHLGGQEADAAGDTAAESGNGAEPHDPTPMLSDSLGSSQDRSPAEQEFLKAQRALLLEHGRDRELRRLGAPWRGTSFFSEERWSVASAPFERLDPDAAMTQAAEANRGVASALQQGKFEFFAWAPPGSGRFEVTVGNQVATSVPRHDQFAAAMLARLDKYPPRRSPRGKRDREITQEQWDRVLGLVVAELGRRETGRRQSWIELMAAAETSFAEHLDPHDAAAIFARDGQVVVIPRHADAELEHAIASYGALMLAEAERWRSGK
jgi:hypothetical protein